MAESIWGNPTDKLAYSSDEPNIQYLYDELHRSLFYGGNMSRLTYSDDKRMCRWEGQSDDGRKYEQYIGSAPFPWEGASDVRNRLIDNVINQMVVLLMASWQRGKLRVSGVEVNDAQQAAAAQTLMNWVVQCKLREELEREAELWIQYTYQFGWSAMHIGWDRKISRRRETITIQEIEQAAQMGNGILAKAFQEIKATPDGDLAVEIISQALQCDKNESKRICKALSEFGMAEYDMPYIQKNLPVCAVLKPYDEVAFPPETVNLQDARVIFKRVFMTEVQFRSIGATEGWDPDFIEQGVHTAGKTGYLKDSNLIPLINTVPNAIEKANNLIEVVYSYARQLDQNDKPAIYYTVFCPMVENKLYGKHEILDYAHGEYPFVEFRRERLRRAVVESRGIPEIIYTDQEELKAQHDAIRDRTAIEVMPPLMVKNRLSTQNRIGPGQLLPVRDHQDYMWLSSQTGTPQTAFALMEMIELKIAKMFGLYHEKVMPALTQTTQQYFVNNFFLSWSQVYKQIFSLCMQYMLPEEIERVCGLPLQVNTTDNNQMFDFCIRYDVRELDTDYVIEKLKSINQFVLPMDTAGAIDRNKLIRKLVEAIAPETAHDILIDQQTATQKQYKDVQNDLAMMMLGLEAQYTENDPQAGAKMQALNDIMSKNPKAQQMSKTDGMFQQLLQNYAKNLQMSITQQQNAQIGRTGVSPVGDKFAEAQQKGEPIEADPNAYIQGINPQSMGMAQPNIQ